MAQIFGLSTSTSSKGWPWIYLSYLVTVISVWGAYMWDKDIPDLFAGQWQVMITMVLGSFVAGSSPEGSASIAYPVFTLLLNISPDDARNFAFAIQSIGMTAASVFIINRRIQIDWRYIGFVTLSGIPGLWAGTWWLLPHIVPSVAKLVFVSLWFGFGLVLWKQNRGQEGQRLQQLPVLGKGDQLALLGFGFAGGLISSLFGTGINILSYCFMVSYYRLSEKVATPSSVIIMTIETLLGFFIHALLIGDFSARSHAMWLACIPIVIFFAPLGAYLIQFLPRKKVALFLSAILMVQYAGAMLVLQPMWTGWLLSGVLVVGSVLLFLWLTVKGEQKQQTS